MKAFAFVSAMFVFSFGYSAQAIIQLPGSFAASMCGYQTFQGNQEASADISQLCIGEIVGNKGEPGAPAVAFRLSNNEVRVFMIVERVSYLMATLSGQTKSLFHLESANGQRATMKVILNPGGKIESASGSLDGIDYVVDEFQPILVIQRLTDLEMGVETEDHLY